MTEINTNTELFAGLRDANQRVTQWFTEIPAENFFTRQGEIWSASDNMDHLIKSHRHISKALKLPKFTLQAMFGKPERRSKTYEEICEMYKAEIAKGAQASGRFFQINKAQLKAPKRKRLNCWSGGLKPAQTLYWSLRNGMIVNWMNIYFRIH